MLPAYWSTRNFFVSFGQPVVVLTAFFSLSLILRLIKNGWDHGSPLVPHIPGSVLSGFYPIFFPMVATIAADPLPWPQVLSSVPLSSGTVHSDLFWPGLLPHSQTLSLLCHTHNSGPASCALPLPFPSELAFIRLGPVVLPGQLSWALTRVWCVALDAGNKAQLLLILTSK